MPTFTKYMLKKLDEKVVELREAGFAVPEPLKEQAVGNKVLIDLENKRITTEFGDFRVELATCHIIVELDGSGIDLTNFVKYWHDLSEHFDNAPVNEKDITLLYVYTQKPEADLHSRVILWKFLQCKILQTLPYPNRLNARLYSIYLEDSTRKEQDIQCVLNDFAESIITTLDV